MSIVKSWFTQTVEGVTGINCDNCKAKIEMMFPDNHNLQGRNMLTVRVQGGYGEYMDGSGEIQLCGDCADLLRKIFPLFDKVISNSFIGGPDWRVDDENLNTP